MRSSVSTAMKSFRSKDLRAIPGARGARRRYSPPCLPGCRLGQFSIMYGTGGPGRGWRSFTERLSLPDRRSVHFPLRHTVLNQAPRHKVLRSFSWAILFSTGNVENLSITRATHSAKCRNTSALHVLPPSLAGRKSQCFQRSMRGVTTPCRRHAS